MEQKSVEWNDVVGLESQKKDLYDLLVLPFEKKDLYAQLVLQPEKINESRTILFSGSPGTGKTYLAQAVCSLLPLSHKFVQSTEVLQKYIGEGANFLREVYSSTSGIVFIDEVETIAHKREQHPLTRDIVSQLLLCLDGALPTRPYATIFATNEPSSLDDAILSRCTTHLQFPEISSSQRKAVLEKHFSYHQHEISSLDHLVKRTAHYDARQLTALFTKARSSALKDDRSYLSDQDFLTQVS